VLTILHLCWFLQQCFISQKCLFPGEEKQSKAKPIELRFLVHFLPIFLPSSLTIPSSNSINDFMLLFFPAWYLEKKTAILLLEHSRKLTIVQPNTMHIYMAKVFYRL